MPSILQDQREALRIQIRRARHRQSANTRRKQMVQYFQVQRAIQAICQKGLDCQTCFQDVALTTISERVGVMVEANTFGGNRTAALDLLIELTAAEAQLLSVHTVYRFITHVCSQQHSIQQDRGKCVWILGNLLSNQQYRGVALGQVSTQFLDLAVGHANELSSWFYSILAAPQVLPMVSPETVKLIIRQSRKLVLQSTDIESILQCFTTLRSILCYSPSLAEEFKPSDLRGVLFRCSHPQLRLYCYQLTSLYIESSAQLLGQFIRLDWWPIIQRGLSAQCADTRKASAGILLRAIDSGLQRMLHLRQYSSIVMIVDKVLQQLGRASPQVCETLAEVWIRVTEAGCEDIGGHMRWKQEPKGTKNEGVGQTGTVPNYPVDGDYGVAMQATERPTGWT